MSMSQFYQHAITAVTTLFVVSLGFIVLEQRIFSHPHQQIVRHVPVPAPILTPLTTSPFGLHPATKKSVSNAQFLAAGQSTL